MKVQNDSGTHYPLTASWSSACSGGSGTFTFEGNWNDMLLSPTSDQCPTFIKLGGNGVGSVHLRYYGQ
jgi:hypothetical protein